MQSTMFDSNVANWTQHQPGYDGGGFLFRDNVDPTIEPPERPTREYQNIIKVLDNYITPIICAFGCLGNILNLIVLNRQRFRRSDGGKETGAHIGLTCLALSDMLFCVCLFPRYLLTSHKSVFESRSFVLYYQVYSTGLITTMILISTWVMVAMATMRYLAICYPLRLRVIDGIVFARVLYGIVFVVCFLVNLPSFWQFTVLELNETTFYLDIGYLDIQKPRGQIFLWFRVIIGTFIPALILMFCNISLIQALRRSNRMRQQYHVNQAASTSKNRITLMLVAIVTAFVLFVFPCELMEFFPEVIKQDRHKTEVFLLIRSVANLLQTLNFAFNFALYCLINAHFRSAVLELLTCGKWKAYSPVNSYRQNSTRSTVISSRHFSVSHCNSDPKNYGKSQMTSFIVPADKNGGLFE